MEIGLLWVVLAEEIKDDNFAMNGCQDVLLLSARVGVELGS